MATLSNIITPTNIITASNTQTLTNKTIDGDNNTITDINLATAVKGTLPAANGGTGLTSPGASGNVLTSNGTNWVATLPREKTWTAITATGTYTVPNNVSSIRVYAFGGGGNGSKANTEVSNGGGGGGCAYGDIAVTPGGVVSISISSGVATVTYAGTTMLTANKGGDASLTLNGFGAGGTASKHVSVTNGGAYTGGNGGGGGTNGGGGGGSAASPLGNGYAGGSNGGGGGGGIGGVGGGGPGGGGGGAGGGGTSTGGGGGGSGGAATNVIGGAGRPIGLAFTDPLIVECLGTGGNGVTSGSTVAIGQTASYGGGGGGANSDGAVDALAGKGGSFGGGGGAEASASNGTSAYGGNGGFCGGGGGAWGGSSGFAQGGNGGYGGGGGGARANSTTAGTGGAAIVLIYA